MTPSRKNTISHVKARENVNARGVLRAADCATGCKERVRTPAADRKSQQLSYDASV